MIRGRRPTFPDSGGMAVPPFESQVCRPTVTLGRPGTDSCLQLGMSALCGARCVIPLSCMRSGWELSERSALQMCA